MSLSIEGKCKIKNCRRRADLIYMGVDVCGEHWHQYADDPAKLCKQLGITKKPKPARDTDPDPVTPLITGKKSKKVEKAVEEKPEPKEGNSSVDALLKELKTTKDPARKRKLSRELRKLGHKGGSRG